jgi:hypothetical protein
MKNTIELILAKQAELDELIQQLTNSCNAAQGKLIQLPETEIALKPGERYAGAMLDSNGQVQCHLVLVAERPPGQMMWWEAMDWAISLGGHLPNRQEQALLYVNCKTHMGAEWYWSGVSDEDDPAFAWGYNIYSGDWCSSYKYVKGAAVAVRVITPELDMS